jgi:peptidyl-prolyl cis-trans isomerase SurA
MIRNRSMADISLQEKRRSRWAVMAFSAALLSASVISASAQQLVARVNGDPITAIELEQRTKLTTISTKKTPSRQEVLDELIDERLKLQTAQRYRLDIPDTEVDTTLNGMASRMRTDADGFAKALAGAGISISTMKRKIRADIAWQQIVRGKFQSSLQVGEKDVRAAAESRNAEKIAQYNYTLHPILLIVQRSAGVEGIENRRKEAENLRLRFQNCEDGLAFARGLRDVAVRSPITRNSLDLPTKLREVLDNTQIGRLTPPDITPQGVELFALCSKKESGSAAEAEGDIRNELYSKRFEAQGKRFLQELRRSARIEVL